MPLAYRAAADLVLHLATRLQVSDTTDVALGIKVALADLDALGCDTHHSLVSGVQSQGTGFSTEAAKARRLRRPSFQAVRSPGGRIRVVNITRPSGRMRRTRLTWPVSLR
jgi:hypothetical protein